VLGHAIETPRAPGVRFHDMITVVLGNLGAIDNVIDDVGGAATAKTHFTAKVTEFP
jgi:hypothetical protein